MKYQTLQLFRPTITRTITQGWGENRVCQKADGAIYGIPKGQTCVGKSFYERMGMEGHNAIDFGSMIGEEVYHAGNFAGWIKYHHDITGGKGVDVVSNEPLFFGHPIPVELTKTAVPYTQDGVIGFLHHVKIRNWHLKSGVGHEGKQVTVGTVVGISGNSGASTNPHLHWAPKWCLKDGRGVGQTNGYYGAFDPTPYMKLNFTAKEHAELLRLNLPLSEDEKKDIKEQLSLAQQLLVALQKLIHKI